MNDWIKGWVIFISGVFALTLVIVTLMIVLPQYNVWRQRMGGQAFLAHAQSAKEVAVAEARAKMEAASLLADAEVARAKGFAAANKIIGESLRDNDAYLRYLWVTEVAGKDVDKTVVYIPTEANLPLLEANRYAK